MKSIAYLLLPTLLLCSLQSALAADDLQSSRSAGKLRDNQAIDLSQQLRDSATLTRPKPVQAENYAAREDASQQAGVANRYDQLFEIYEADVQLLADLDGDGFHHAINVSFDVDVSVGSATVYAKLYLSREGEPWTQYFTTDLFVIHGDDYGDAYEVETELVDGYAPGYYAVLVEIYSLDHAYMVASEVLDYQTLGRDLMIEDLQSDEPYAEPSGGYGYYQEEYYYSSGGGSFASLLLFFLVLQVVIAARGSLALFPRNDGENKKKMTP